MAHSIRRRVDAGTGPPNFERMVRQWNRVTAREVTRELNLRAHFVGPAERRRRKDRRAQNRRLRSARRVEKAAAREAAAA